MEYYFHKKFELLKFAVAEEEIAPIVAEDASANESQAIYHGFSHLIKPDMIINTYSLLEFWLKQICDHQKAWRNLKLSHKDIKGKNDFHGYHKYLAEYAGIDLADMKDSYMKINDLRKVRNVMIHHGGYVQPQEENQYSNIEGISISITGTLLIIEDEFVWDTLNHVKQYLLKAALA